MNCENCNQEHDGEFGSGRFCCSKCARGFSTKTRREEINKRVSETLMGHTSPLKGKPGRKHSEETKRKIGEASKRVAEETGRRINREEFIELWKTGNMDPKLAETREKMIRDYLIREAGNKCPKCGWGEKHPVTGRVPLQMDHKDGDHWNNHPDNVHILCPNCHSLTPNFMTLNKLGKMRRKKGLGQSGGI